MTFRLTTVVALVWLTACGPQFLLRDHGDEPPIIFTDVQTHLELYASTLHEDLDRPIPSQLSCSVTAPSGAPMICATSPWERLTPGEVNGFGRLSFTANEIGWHTVKVSVKEGAKFEWRLYAMPRRSEPSTLLDRSCQWLEAFPDGAWLCDGAFLRKGEAAQETGAEHAAAAGDFIWTYSAGKLARFAEPRAHELLAAPQQSLETGLVGVTALMATPADVLLVHPNGVVRFEVDAAGTLRRTASLARAIPDQSVVRRSGTRVLLAHTLVPFVLGNDPANDVEPQTEVCVFSLSGADFVQDSCQRITGSVRGIVDDGVLLQNSKMIVAIDFDLASAELELPEPALLSFTARGVNLLSSTFPSSRVAPKWREGVLTLEMWPGGTTASEALVWSTQTRSTSVMRR